MYINMRPIRGSRVVISISKSANAATVLSTAVAKFPTHDRKFVTSEPRILYSDFLKEAMSFAWMNISSRS